MEMQSSITIRQMRKEDLTFAAECTKAEGWVSENRDMLDSFFLNDPEGCLVAEEDGRQVGICIATNYISYGFIGELIVRPDVRGVGIGTALLNKAVEFLKIKAGLDNPACRPRPGAVRLPAPGSRRPRRQRARRLRSGSS